MVNQSDNGERRLTAALRTVAADDALRRASPEVEARLRGEVRALARERRARAVWLAVAASLTVAALVPAYRVFLERAASAPASTPSQTASATGEVTTPFLPLTYNDVPMSDGQLVRLEVPREALESFGLTGADIMDGRSTGTVLADVLVGEDGLARAVRFVRPTAAQQEQIQ